MPVPVVTPLRMRSRAPRVLTIDVEDWFHVCGDDYYSDPKRWNRFPSRIQESFLELLDRLELGGHRATLFFLGWIARRHPELVAEAVRRGHEAGVHGDVHRRAYEMTASEFRDDLARSSEAIERAGATHPLAYRAAEWSIRGAGEPALAILAEEGFICDASMTPIPPLGRADNLPGPHAVDVAGRRIVEIPPLTGRGFGRTIPMGGGWSFRMFGTDRLERAEAAFRDAGWPAVFTFHPWEFDRRHPSMDGLPPLLRLVHFYGLASLPARFERWLAREGDRCVPLRDVLPLLAG